MTAKRPTRKVKPGSCRISDVAYRVWRAARPAMSRPTMSVAIPTPNQIASAASPMNAPKAATLPVRSLTDPPISTPSA